VRQTIPFPRGIGFLLSSELRSAAVTIIMVRWEGDIDLISHLTRALT
jgi:hypothetical protein